MNEIFDSFPVILLDDIILRKINAETDCEAFFHYINNHNVAAYLSELDIPVSLESAKNELGYWNKLFDNKHSFYWAITHDNKIIGTCGFNYWNKDQRRAEISYDLDYNYWNRGITTKAIKAICDFLFNNTSVQRIQATVALENIGSIRVLEKSGFIRESLLKKYGVLKGQSKDFYMYTRFY